MAGQVIKRGERTYLVRIFLGRDGRSGRRRYASKTVHGNKKEAQQVLNAMLRERDMGTLVEPVKVALNEYLDRWLETAAKPRVRPRTLDGYRELLDRYIRPPLGDFKLAKIDPLVIQRTYNKMQERGLSPKTIRHAHGVLRSALNQAVKWRMLASNPATLVDLPRLERPEMLVLSGEQAACFLEHAARDKWGALFTLALTTGMRPGEYLALQWRDVDFDKGTVVVRRTLSTGKGGKWYFAEPKTKSSYRTIPVPKSVTRALVEHRRKQAAEKLAAGPAYEDHDLVFANATGQPLNERNLVNRHFKRILKNAGLPEKLRLYDLRHTCATLLLAEGENPKVVGERLGHAGVTLTLDTYSHVLPTMQQRAAERLEAVLFGDR